MFVTVRHRVSVLLFLFQCLLTSLYVLPYLWQRFEQSYKVLFGKRDAFLLFLVPQMYPDRSPKCHHGNRLPIIDLHSFFKLPHPYTPVLFQQLPPFRYNTCTAGVFRGSKGLIHCTHTELHCRQLTALYTWELPPWFSELASLDLCVHNCTVASSQLCIQECPPVLYHQMSALTLHYLSAMIFTAAENTSTQCSYLYIRNLATRRNIQPLPRGRWTCRAWREFGKSNKTRGM